MRRALFLIPLLFLQACKAFHSSTPIPPKLEYSGHRPPVHHRDNDTGYTSYWTAVPHWLPEGKAEYYEDGTCCFVQRVSENAPLVQVHLMHGYFGIGNNCSWELNRVNQIRDVNGSYSSKVRIEMWNDRNHLDCEQLTPLLINDDLFRKFAEPEWLAAEEARRANGGTASQQAPTEESPQRAVEVATAAPLVAPTPSKGGTTLKDVLEEAGQFSGFLKALEDSGAMAWLTGAGPYVVLAPTDAAYGQMAKRVKKQLAGEGFSKEEIQAFWLRHIVSGSYTYEQLAELKSVQPVAGESLKILVKDEYLRIHRSNTTGSPLSAPNGVIIPIDKVIYD
ncbi:fasciclin domain-containing protein [Pyxidicoccus sp. MSG2]|uniref:fasciclin domain-containing protein n=1 Tax=Pyxidicoccus sp. MSG2 TaxID=2996790 RepID=UPI002270B4B0|nr:fasciclin domain-containing protein [Pyxidicoccus sp. MSG2]MCY1021746.1 fasciclin domain-containing protein [Pyxidicoccus sp. MSG2]